MDEFEEIAHTGGTITFIHDPKRGTAIELKHSNPWKVVIYQVCVSFDGEILEFVPPGGIGAVIPYPQPSILAFLISDREGLFGQHCPECKSYFRSDCIGGNTTCPYCLHAENGIEFLTENQAQFIGTFCNTFIEAHQNGKTIEVDLNELIDGLPSNKPGWVYSEERQQSKYNCISCKATYDILGEYGTCPCCGETNYREVIESKLDLLDQEFAEANEAVEDRHDREVEWEKLTRCISEFEALANSVRKSLLSLPLTPKRRSDISQLSFQRILNAADRLKEWFEIDILKDVSKDDQAFLKKMFNRRHIFTHNAGKVDQEYIDNTGDTSVRLNQTIRFQSREIRRLLPLVRQCATNLMDGLSSIE